MILKRQMEIFTIDLSGEKVDTLGYQGRVVKYYKIMTAKTNITNKRKV